jgi:hypothetical protein
MAIMFSRDQETGEFLIEDTADPAATRRFATQEEFNYAALVLLLQATERLEAGLARLEALYPHEDRPCTIPPPPDVRDTLPTGADPFDILARS